MKKNSTTLQDNEKEYLKQYYPYLDKKTILSELGKSWASVKWHAKKLGISRPNIREAKLKKLLPHSIETSYWWGFIMSDGYISDKGELVFALSTKDECQLYNLISFLGHESNVQRQEDVYMSRLSIMDRVNGLKLKEILQITNKKTYNPPNDFSFLKTPEQRLAFYIGFVDGDGSIHHDKNETFKCCRIVIHENWYSWWVVFCNQLALDYPKLKFTVNTNNKRKNTLIYIGKKETKEFLKKFIQENKIQILERKWKLLN